MEGRIAGCRGREFGCSIPRSTWLDPVYCVRLLKQLAVNGCAQSLQIQGSRRAGAE